MADVNPDGVLGAAKDLDKPLETWRYLFTPEQQADVDWEDKGVPEGIGGARPSGWQSVNAEGPAKLDDVAPRSMAIRPAPVPDNPPGYVLDQLARSEGTADDNPKVKAHYPSGSGYDAVYGYAETAQPISGLTVPAVRERQKQMAGPTPYGRYQINGPTIDTLSKKLKLRDSEVFSPDLQDRMARQLLADHGWNAFMNGQINEGQFGHNLEPVWSSLKDPAKMAEFQKVLSQIPRRK